MIAERSPGGEKQAERYNKVVEACVEQLEVLAAACPYDQDGITRGLQVSILLGSDEVEQWAVKASGSSGGAQLRF